MSRGAFAGVGGRSRRRTRDRRRCDVRLVRIAGPRGPARLAHGEHRSRAEPQDQQRPAVRPRLQRPDCSLAQRRSTHFARIPSQGPGAKRSGRCGRRTRAQNVSAIEPHSIYLGTLAELGVIGLALLLVVLVPPLGAALRSRHSPLVPAVLAAYVCWMVHSGLDWDWTLVGVTGPGLLCGVALLAGSRGEATAPRPIVLVAAVSVAAVVGLMALTSVHRKRPAVLGQRRDHRRSRRPGRCRGARRAALRTLVGRGVGTRRRGTTGSGTQGRSARGLQEGRRSRPQQLARVDTACGNGDGCRAPPRRSRRAAAQSARTARVRNCLARR